MWTQSIQELIQSHCFDSYAAFHSLMFGKPDELSNKCRTLRAFSFCSHRQTKYFSRKLSRSENRVVQPVISSVTALFPWVGGLIRSFKTSFSKMFSLFINIYWVTLNFIWNTDQSENSSWWWFHRSLAEKKISYASAFTSQAGHRMWPMLTH